MTIHTYIAYSGVNRGIGHHARLMPNVLIKKVMIAQIPPHTHPKQFVREIRNGL